MTQRSYKTMGINLKAMPMGESDRLVTVLTKEQGLVRAIAPGARKHKSKLGGRSGLFVVNDLLFVKGKSIDKLVQAETLRSFPGLSKDLAKLTASQYLAEIVLSQALTDQPQAELYYLLIEHLGRLEAATRANVLPCLVQAVFHLLVLAGVAPEVFRCCLSRSPLVPELGNPDWYAGFSVSSGGVVDMAELQRMESDRLKQIAQARSERLNRSAPSLAVHDASADYLPQSLPQSLAKPSATQPPRPGQRRRPVVSKELTANLGIVGYLSAAELALMQQLSQPELILSVASSANPKLAARSGTIEKAGTPAKMADHSEPHIMWRHIEKILRQYTQYQFDRPIRSATLIDTCFTSSTHASRV
ncbi:DNA repair protein RecO [Leptolyngbya sp. BC1307]|uniref:DNA repair protein RecO n=1 Tax=Leptolyngbya sp. BC1307 TaxID=2029589 RepID=UPI000EFA314F|nr:DNA repair protein RecO [Leptolyngbya sp. BC1307]